VLPCDFVVCYPKFKSEKLHEIASESGLGISSLPMGRNGILPGRKPFFQEEIGKKLPRVTESLTTIN